MDIHICKCYRHRMITFHDCSQHVNKIQSKNNSQDNERYKAYTKLEETYYSVSVSNRAKYSTKSELVSALQKKYFQDDTYSQYDYNEKDAMLLNEMNMTLYGCLNSGGNVNDPHLRGNVRDSSESEKQLYNRKMVNVQIGNLLSSGGINTDLLGNSKLKFSIDPYDFSLKVSGVDDEKISDQIEKILNSGNNSKELFYHILHSNSSGMSENVLKKYRVMRDFKDVTGEDIRNYTQSGTSLVNSDGMNALDVYRTALKTSNTVPTEYKSDAYNYFKDNLEALLEEDFSSIPDMDLSIGYQNGTLQDLSNDIMNATFDVSV